jgi:hypothetical protein
VFDATAGVFTNNLYKYNRLLIQNINLFMSLPFLITLDFSFSSAVDVYWNLLRYDIVLTGKFLDWLTLKIGALYPFDTSGTIYQTVRRIIPEDYSLHNLMPCGCVLKLTPQILILF